MAPITEKVSSTLYVPEDVMFSILSKLSLKSVNRFTCVHKSWSLLFENPSFMKMFCKNLISKYHSLYDGASLLLNHYDSADHEWKLNLLSGERFENKVQMNWPHPLNGKGYYKNKILGSAINGILCIYDIDNESNIVLWNPATEELNRVHENRARLFHQYENHYSIHGFGYNPVRDDYKIIQRVDILGVLEEYDQGVPSGPIWDIYSLRNNSWKKLHVDMRNNYMCSDAVYLNGVCHWCGKQWYGQSYHETYTYVVSFNLSTEMPVTTILPSDLHNLERADRHLAELNGFVAMITSYVKTASSSYHISIAILGEPGVNDSWTKLFDFGPFSGIMEFIGAGMNGDIFFRKDANDDLVFLDLTTGAIENIGVKAEKWRAQIIIYKKNVLPIRGMNN